MSYNNADLKSYIQDINRYPLLSREDEVQLSKKSLAGDDQARQKLISSNLKLVVKIAYSYSRKEEAIKDFIQEGNIGLITAAGKFDYRKEVKFSTYATWWIRQNIMRYILNNNVIRLPTVKELKLRRVQGFIDEYHLQNNQYPDLREIENHFGLSHKELLSFWEYRNPTMSLSQPADKYYDVSETISDRRFSPEKMSLSRSLISDIKRAFHEVLCERERYILHNRFSLVGRKKLTLKELGETLGLTSEAVRLIEKKALEKLRVQREDLGLLYKELQIGKEQNFF